MINKKKYLSILLSASIFGVYASTTAASSNELVTSSALTQISTTETADTQALTKASVVYSYDEMLNFNISDYLSQNASHLLPYAESISHYAGRSSISPKVFIALLEYQTQAVTQSVSGDSLQQKPFGTLSAESGFNQQLADISDRMAKAFYAGHSYADTGINAKLTTDADARKAVQMVFSWGIDSNQLQPGSLEELNAFSKVFNRLFPEANSSSSNNSGLTSVSDGMQTMLVPSVNLLQLPYPVGNTWTYGGSHTHTGSGSYPQSSLDLNNGGYWGDNLSHLWVTAAAGGQVVRHSSCQLEVIHSGGWSTNYYHLSNIRVSHGSNISRNTAIANYASNKSQALCEGGSSTGPHVHFSLKQNGQYYHLNGVSLSGFKVHTGRDSYDGNCSYFWFEKNGSKYCAWSRINNPGVGDDDGGDDTTIYEMTNGQVRSNISGSTGVKYYYKIDVPAGASDLKIESYNGSGDVDMYLRRGALPTTSAYDCRPYKNGNNETCTVSSPAAGTYYILLHGYSAFSGLSLKTTFSTGGSDGGGYTDTNISGSNGEMKKYWIDVPSGMKTLTVKVIGNNGDADLYVKKTAYPTTSSYDCRPYKSGSTETCTFSNPEGRRWYIGIHAYSNFSGLTLEATWTP